MPNRRHVLISGTAFVSLGAKSVFAQSADRPNPMPEELRKSLERDPYAPVLGNPKGNITLTEFFDYNCPFCRKMVSLIPKLISSDPQLRVVYREWPTFGEGSLFAARASLASLKQRKYWPFHVALMSMQQRAEEATVMRIVRKVGLDEEKLRADMDSADVEQHIRTSRELAGHMGLIGTPTFIAGDEAVFGEMTLKEMQKLVARGRATLGLG